MTLTRKVIHSVSWLILLRYSTRVIDIGKYFLITRILSPTDVGNFILATTVVITFEALSDTGLSFAFIQKQLKISHYAKTLWIISIIRGVLIGTIIIVFSGVLSSFFNSPQLLPLLIAISLVPIIKGFQSPYVLLFQKNLDFKKEFIYKFIPVVVASLSSILFAVLLQNSMGLILAIVIGSIIEVASSFLITKTTFPKPFSIKKAKSLFQYGKYLTMGSIFTLLITQADSLFVGKVFGTATLALYELAFKVANIAFSEVTDIISRVSFPLFSKIQKERSKLLKSFKINVAAVSLPAFAAMVLFLAFPEFILKTAFGETYTQAALLLQILSIYGFIRAVVGPTGPLLLAIGKPKVTSVMNFFNFFFLILLLFPLSHVFGIEGVALAMVLSYFFIQPYLLYHLIAFYKKT